MAPLITSALENILLSARKGYKITQAQNKFPTKEMNELVQSTLEHQLTAAIIFFLQGYLSSNWGDVQNLYLKKKGFNEKLTDWSTKVIQAI